MYGASLAPGEAQYLVDDGRLDDSFVEQEVLLFRRSKELNDVAEDGAPWGTTIIGVEEGGWLEVGGMYLPMAIQGLPVLTLLRRRDRSVTPPAQRQTQAPPASPPPQPQQQPQRGPQSLAAWDADSFRAADRLRRQQLGERFLEQRERLARLVGVAWRRYRRRRDARRARACCGARLRRFQACRDEPAALIQRAWRRRRVVLLRARQGKPWLQRSQDAATAATPVAMPSPAGNRRASFWSVSQVDTLARAAAESAEPADEEEHLQLDEAAGDELVPGPAAELCATTLAVDASTDAEGPVVMEAAVGEQAHIDEPAGDGREAESLPRSASGSRPRIEDSGLESALQETARLEQQAFSPPPLPQSLTSMNLDNFGRLSQEDLRSGSSRSDSSTPRSAINEALSVASSEELGDPRDLPPLEWRGPVVHSELEATCLPSLPPPDPTAPAPRQPGRPPMPPSPWARHARRVVWTKPVMPPLHGAYRQPLDLQAAQEIRRPKHRLLDRGRAVPHGRQDLLKEDTVPVGLLPQMKIPGRYALAMREPIR